jgi:hypothetical protein
MWSQIVQALFLVNIMLKPLNRFTYYVCTLFFEWEGTFNFRSSANTS